MKVVRHFEKLTKQKARFRNHLVFSLRCKQTDVTPVSLRLRCPINKQRANNIIRRAERGLLSERIHVVNGKLAQLEAKRDNLQRLVDQSLSGDTRNQIAAHIQETYEHEFQRAKTRQINKFDRMTKAHTHNDISKTSDDFDLSGAQLKKWVVNLSKYTLDKVETSVLSKGLNFAVTPSVVLVEDFVVTTERACSHLPPAQAECLRSDITNVLRKARHRSQM